MTAKIDTLEKSESSLKETLAKKTTELTDLVEIKDTEIQKWKDVLVENEKLLAALREESNAQRSDHDLVMKE